jgi:hypothetical protein
MEWQIKSHHLYTIFMPPKEDLSSLRGYLLLEATDAGKIEDTMQMMVHGDNTITTTINATAITGLQELEQYTLTYETRPEEIHIKRNTSSTPWEDLAEMVAKNNIIPYKNGEEATAEFLADLKTAQEEDYTRGAVLRWAVHATEDYGLQLCLLSLPASEAYTKGKAVFRLDTCPATVINTIPLGTTPGTAVRGPQPVLFTHDVQRTTTILQQQPYQAYPGISRALKRFPMTEHLNQREAMQYVKQPALASPIFPLGEILQPEPGPSSMPAKRAAEEILAAPRGISKRPYIIPEDDQSVRKYNDQALRHKKLFTYQKFAKVVPPQMHNRHWYNTFLKLSSTAISKTSWDKYCCAIKKLGKYARDFSIDLSWPLAGQELQGFTLWCLHKEKLSADTVKSYLYSLSHIQKLHGYAGIPVAASPIIPSLLKGAKNKAKTRETPRPRDPVTFDRLKVIREAIMTSN